MKCLSRTRDIGEMDELKMSHFLLMGRINYSWTGALKSKKKKGPFPSILNASYQTKIPKYTYTLKWLIKIVTFAKPSTINFTFSSFRLVLTNKG